MYSPLLWPIKEEKERLTICFARYQKLFGLDQIQAKVEFVGICVLNLVEVNPNLVRMNKLVW